jgi:neutral ceramidase
MLRIGLAKLEVTPPLTVPYLSYYPRHTAFQGIHDPLLARALVAENDSTRLAIVTVDSLGLNRAVLGEGRDFIAEVRERTERRTGIPGQNVLIAATHAHSTPATSGTAPLNESSGPGRAGAVPGAEPAFPDVEPWLEELAERLARAVEQAWAGRAPAELRGAVGMAAGIAWCRRIVTRDGRLVTLQHRPSDDQVVKEPRDDRVPVLLARGEDWCGATIGFTCHPVTVQVQPLVSADFPGVACGIVERELAARACLFLQGAAGNVNPVRGTTDFQDVAVYGGALGGEALRLLSLLGARDVAPMSEALAVGSETVEVQRRPLPDVRNLERQVAEREALIPLATTESERREAIAAYRRVVEPLRLARLGAAPVRIEVQALRLGEALIVAVEGELFVEYGNRIKEASPAPVTFVAAYSNGQEGYIPTPESFDEGGYEVAPGPWTRVGRNAGDEVTARAIALAQRVWREGATAR